MFAASTCWRRPLQKQRVSLGREGRRVGLQSGSRVVSRALGPAELERRGGAVAQQLRRRGAGRRGREARGVRRVPEPRTVSADLFTSANARSATPPRRRRGGAGTTASRRRLFRTLARRSTSCATAERTSPWRCCPMPLEAGGFEQCQRRKNQPRRSSRRTQAPDAALPGAARGQEALLVAVHPRVPAPEREARRPPPSRETRRVRSFEKTRGVADLRGAAGPRRRAGPTPAAGLVPPRGCRLPRVGGARAR